jgi:hypothetical protein
MPVIGGYLAYIGYFCVQAGVGLAISYNMTSIMDWTILFQSSTTNTNTNSNTTTSYILLALPALITGLLFTWITRNIKNDVVLPISMILVPTLFYIIIYILNIGMDGARSAGWMGGKY